MRNGYLLAATLVLSGAGSAALHAQTSLDDFSLSPSPTPPPALGAAPEAAQGPTDGDVPPPAVQTAPRIVPRPLPQFPRQTETVQPLPLPVDQPENRQSPPPPDSPVKMAQPLQKGRNLGIAPQGKEATTSTFSGAPVSEPQDLTDSADNPEGGRNATEARSIEENTRLVAPGELPPAADLRKLEYGTSIWPWLAGLAIIILVAGWIARTLLKRRKSSQKHREEPVLAQGPQNPREEGYLREAAVLRQSPDNGTGAENTTPASRIPPTSATPPSRKAAGSKSPIFTIEAIRLETTLVNLVLTYRATITAAPHAEIEDVQLFSRLGSAHRATSLDELIRPDFNGNVPDLKLDDVGPGKQIVANETQRLALATTRPIVAGSSVSVVPIAQFMLCCKIGGQEHVEHVVMLLGLESRADPARLAPIRLDKGPKLHAPLRSKILTP